MWCWVLNSIQLLLRPISNLMTHFAEETNFLEDLSDLLTKSGTLATSDQCQTHPHNLIKSNFSRHISRRNTISPKFSSSIEWGTISYWQGHSWIFLRCGRTDIWNISSATLPLSRPQHCRCQSSSSSKCPQGGRNIWTISSSSQSPFVDCGQILYANPLFPLENKSECKNIKPLIVANVLTFAQIADDT